MDLSSLSERNQGVAYELGKLVNEVPLNRVVLLYNDSTDLNVLKHILSRAWAGMAADSPNRQTVEPRVRVFYMGGATGRGPNESIYDWKRRIRVQMDEHALVGLLCDAAQPPRTVRSIDPKRDRNAIRWSRLAIPRWVRWAVNVVWWTFLFSVAAVSVYRMAHAG
jgi:hypothetical protein